MGECRRDERGAGREGKGGAAGAGVSIRDGGDHAERCEGEPRAGEGVGLRVRGEEEGDCLRSV